MVAVATLDGKAYYTITSLLKNIGISYVDVKPGESIKGDVKLVLTTKKERAKVEFERVLCIEDMEDLGLAGEKVLEEVLGERGDTLLIGVDPGSRIGIAAYHGQEAVVGEVASSVQEAVSLISRMVRSSQAKRRVVRVGDGDPALAERLAARLLDSLNGLVELELVDERGTSSLSRMKPNKRGIRDLRSACLIALRQGRRYTKSGKV